MESKNTFDLSQFVRLEKVGKGQFGAVYRVKDKNSDLVYAAKIILKKFDEDSASIQSIRSLIREVNTLSQLNHPSIVKFHGYSRTDFQGNDNPVLITEFLTRGSLKDVIESERRGCSDIKWTETQKLITLYGIAAAMSYLHQHHIIHRDLKPANILMDEQLCPKIADFGLSKVIHLNEDSLSMASTGGFKGTYLYSSPEIINDDEYSFSSDVYAYGIISYEIITNEEPIKNLSFTNLILKVGKGIRPRFTFEIPECYS